MKIIIFSKKIESSSTTWGLKTGPSDGRPYSKFSLKINTIGSDADHRVELRHVENRDAEFPRLVRFAAGGVADQHVIRFGGHAAPCLAAVFFDSCVDTVACITCECSGGHDRFAGVFRIFGQLRRRPRNMSTVPSPRHSNLPSSRPKVRPSLSNLPL